MTEPAPTREVPQRRGAGYWLPAVLVSVVGVALVVVLHAREVLPIAGPFVLLALLPLLVPLQERGQRAKAARAARREARRRPGDRD